MHESSLFISKPPHNWFGEERRRMAELEDEGEPMKEETNNSWAPLHSSSSPVNPQLMMSALLGFSVPPSVFICSGLLSAWRPGTLRRHHPSTVDEEAWGNQWPFLSLYRPLVSLLPLSSTSPFSSPFNLMKWKRERESSG